MQTDAQITLFFDKYVDVLSLLIQLNIQFSRQLFSNYTGDTKL
jgi:hypothetical protein